MGDCKTLYEVFPNADDRRDYTRFESQIIEMMKRELTREERIVAYLRYYAPFYGRCKRKKLKGCGERSIAARTGISLWRVRMIILSFKFPYGHIPTPKYYDKHE